MTARIFGAVILIDLVVLSYVLTLDFSFTGIE